MKYPTESLVLDGSDIFTLDDPGVEDSEVVETDVDEDRSWTWNDAGKLNCRFRMNVVKEQAAREPSTGMYCDKMAEKIPAGRVERRGGKHRSTEG